MSYTPDMYEDHTKNGRRYRIFIEGPSPACPCGPEYQVWDITNPDMPKRMAQKLALPNQTEEDLLDLARAELNST